MGHFSQQPRLADSPPAEYLTSVRRTSGRLDGWTVGRVIAGVVLVSVGPTVRLCVAQSPSSPPRAANPERPTVATHAYAVRPGYVELEQGIRALGVNSLSEGTSWDFNLKIGVTDALQLGFFGAGYVRTGVGSGVGDLGWALKWRGDLSATSAVALVPAVTIPTGDEDQGLGAGRVLASLVGVYSADLSWGGGLHFDLNAGPAGVGAGTPQWFTSVGLGKSAGRLGVAVELFDFTAGTAGPRQRGLLGSVLVTLAEWAIVDAGGVWGLTAGSPDQLFLGSTTNLGRMFK